MQLLTPIAVLLSFVPIWGTAPPPSDVADPESASKPDPVELSPRAGPEPASSSQNEAVAGSPADAGSPAGAASQAAGETTELPQVEMTSLSPDYQPPFASDELELSEVLKSSLEHNFDLRANAIDIEISEAQVLAAVGAYDLFLTAGLNGTMLESPQRGSAFTFSTASRTVGGNIGFNRRFETGGTVSLVINASRNLNEQLRNFFDASAGSTNLSTYTIQPILTLSHPLLRGAGLKVNRADINRARIATSTAEATRLVRAQELVRDIVSAYWDLLFAHRDLENKRRSVELAQRQLERTQALVAAGRQSPVDAKSVEQGLAVRESDVIQAENALLDASLNLRTLMGQSLADRDTLGVVPATDPVVRPRTVNVRDEVDRALAQSPQIRQVQLSIASRRIDELVAANNRLPQLDVSATFTPQGRSVDSAPDATSGDPGAQGSWPEAFRNVFSDNVSGDGLLADWTLSGQITLTWDVQNRGPKGQHEAALAQLRQAELSLAQTRQQTAAGVIRAANGLRTAAKVMEVAEISLELARDNLEAEQARFNVGRSTNYDVLQRLDEVDQAAASALNAQISYLKALAQLQALNGEILPAYGIDVL